MQKIPKCKTKFIIPQPNGLKITKKEYLAEESNTININNAQKISQKKLKFSGNRRFGKDITNAIKINVKTNLMENSINNTNLEKTSTNIYIKKHSSVSSVVQNNTKKNQENNTGAEISKKNHSTSIFNSKIINAKHQHTISEVSNPKIKNTKLHNAISFGINVPEEALSNNKKRDNINETSTIVVNRNLM